MKPELRRFLYMYSHIQGALSTILLFQLLLSTYPLGEAIISSNDFGEMVPEILMLLAVSVITSIVAALSFHDYMKKRVVA